MQLNVTKRTASITCALCSYITMLHILMWLSEGFSNFDFVPFCYETELLLLEKKKGEKGGKLLRILGSFFFPLP